MHARTRSFSVVPVLASVLFACEARPLQGMDATVTQEAATPNDATTVDAAPDAAPPAPPPSEPGSHRVTLLETRQVIPGPGLPTEATVQPSNNNVDVARHTDGRVYLAWRTAPDHYASSNTRLQVLSSADERTWRWETSFQVGGDLREPRFLAWNGRLILYMTRLGTDPFRFQPMGVSMTERSPDGTWTPLREVYVPGFLAWRTRVVRGVPYMLGYLYGEREYDFTGLPMEVHFLTTADGVTWRGVDPGQPVVSLGGGSEADFALTDDGSLRAVVRNETYDDAGAGMKLCTAPASGITTWSCRMDPRKYDSPLVFQHDGDTWIIGRRNVSPTGNYDIGQTQYPPIQRTVYAQLDYRNRPKRCSLWRWIPGENRVGFVLDLPSRGDTCYPAVVDDTVPGRFIVYNYSCDVDGPDLTWSQGQQSHTNLYRSVLQFERL